MRFFCLSWYDPSPTAAPQNIWTGSYNLASGNTRIVGMGPDGIGFQNTTIGRNLECFDSAFGQYAGMVVVYVDTTGKSNITVSWRGRSITNAASNRQFGINLEYSPDNGATWSFVGSGYLGNAAGHNQLINDSLPASADNNPNVVLRWRYYYNVGSSGDRQSLALDDISINGT